MKMLRRHLQTAYGMTPEAYRAKGGLPNSYPMVTPNYAERRSVQAKQIGLGCKALSAPAVTKTPVVRTVDASTEATVQVLPERKRGRRKMVA